MYSYADMVLMRPFPAKNPGSIVAIHSTAPGARLDDMSYPDYLDISGATRTLSAVVCYKTVSAGVSRTVKRRRG